MLILACSIEHMEPDNNLSFLLFANQAFNLPFHVSCRVTSSVSHRQEQRIVKRFALNGIDSFLFSRKRDEVRR